MKILFVSMHSVHTVRWIENLKDTNNEIFWFDVMSRGKLDGLNNVTQITDWKKRKIPYIKGEKKFSRKFPEVYSKTKRLLETTESEALEKIINEIQPDVVHSFEMQHCSYPILRAMKNFPNLKWIYSCWGSDLFYYKDFKTHNAKIRNILKRIDFLHTDCLRDYNIAKDLGFENKFLGVIPGGTGYFLEDFLNDKLPVTQRKIILVKGYQHKFGRAITVIKALAELKSDIKDYEVVVFGAHKEVYDFVIKNNLGFKVFGRNELSQKEIMPLMGKSLIYIGNSTSDGIPNTLLEAIVMGTFPIQSNPGKVTEEIIKDNNGLIINNPESTLEIKNLILDALKDVGRLKKAQEINSEIAISKLDFEKNRDKVIAIYNSI